MSFGPIKAKVKTGKGSFGHMKERLAEKMGNGVKWGNEKISKEEFAHRTERRNAAKRFSAKSALEHKTYLKRLEDTKNK